jgi:hypothetical protein
MLISIRNVCNFIILSTPNNLEKKEILEVDIGVRPHLGNKS